MTVLVAGTYALNPFGPQLAASHAVPEASCVNSRAATPGPSIVFIVMAFLASCHYAALELGKKKTLQATKSMMFKSRESSCKGGVPKVG